VADAVAAADRGTHVIGVDLGVDLPPVLTDRVRLGDVLAKLLDNAQKFSEPGSTISIRATVDHDDVVITVADRGCGIPPDMLDRVFEPFVQVDSSTTRPAGGLGTGLFLVRSIGAAIGATVTARSEVGIGTELSLRLMAARADDPVG
jgi:two-component system sensor histidine kinase ResE